MRCIKNVFPAPDLYDLATMPFLVFEGLDGSGKSSLIQELEKTLSSRYIQFRRTREPGGTPFADEIRELILKHSQDAPTAKCELLLYEASRAQHVEKVIRPNLLLNKWVLCDRYTASSVAFQGSARGIRPEDVESLNEFATSGLRADLTILLDLTVEEARKRRLSRGQQKGEKEDRIEAEADEFHQRVRQGFLNLAYKESDQWLILDARKTVLELHQELVKKCQEKKWI